MMNITQFVFSTSSLGSYILFKVQSEVVGVHSATVVKSRKLKEKRKVLVDPDSKTEEVKGITEGEIDEIRRKLFLSQKLNGFLYVLETHLRFSGEKKVQKTFF
jgi:hypothetical protein